MLYTGITGQFDVRLYQPRQKLQTSFTQKYNVNILIWYEEFHTPLEAIRAEKQIKGWRRSKKIELIQKSNPTLRDLSYI